MTINLTSCAAVALADCLAFCSSSPSDFQPESLSVIRCSRLSTGPRFRSSASQEPKCKAGRCREDMTITYCLSPPSRWNPEPSPAHCINSPARQHWRNTKRLRSTKGQIKVLLSFFNFSASFSFFFFFLIVCFVTYFFFPTCYPFWTPCPSSFPFTERG